MTKRILKEELNFILWAEIYQRFDSPGTKRRALNIIETAISCISKKGFNEITYDMIAREAGVSRSLLKHYFKNIDEIKILSLKYIRNLFQRLVVENTARQPGPQQMIKTYIEQCFYWVSHNRKHALVWLGFLHLCGSTSKFRKMNSAAVNAGTERIGKIIRDGISLHEFHCTDAGLASKAIQNLITGSLLSALSDDNAQLSATRDMVIKTTWQLLGAKGIANAEH